MELRPVMGMTRLWWDQVKRDEALPQVGGGFTEGFETLDLKEAKTLLDARAS